MELVTRKQSFGGDTMSTSAPENLTLESDADAAPPCPPPDADDLSIKMREALAASTRHLESKDYDQVGAAEHAADHTLTFVAEDTSGDDASSKAADSVQSSSLSGFNRPLSTDIGNLVEMVNPMRSKRDSEGDAALQSRQARLGRLVDGAPSAAMTGDDATPSSNDGAAACGAAKSRGRRSWCRRHFTQ